MKLNNNLSTFAILFFTAAFVLVCCTHGPKTKTGDTRGRADTLHTLGVFLNNDRKRVIDYVYVITKDTLVIDGDLKVVNKRDTVYYTLNNVPQTDSLGRPVVDSLKRPVARLLYVATPKQFVFWQAGKNIDTLLSATTIPTVK